jgi:hypothetical protein
MSVHYDLSGISQGSTYSLTFRAVDSAGVPVSLSGYSIRSTIREKYSSTTGIASFNSSITTPNSGICNIALTASGAAAIAAGIYLYSVEVENYSTLDVIKLLDGHAYVNPEILY